jgi:hypothetical protein
VLKHHIINTASNLACEFLDLIWFSGLIYEITESTFQYLQTAVFLMQIRQQLVILSNYLGIDEVTGGICDSNNYGTGEDDG